MPKKKQHEKAKIERTLCVEGKMFPCKDFELRQCYGETGKLLGMFWVNKKKPEMRFRKIRNDVIERTL